MSLCQKHFNFFFSNSVCLLKKKFLMPQDYFPRNQMILMFLEIQNCPTYQSQEKEILFPDSSEYCPALIKQ